MARDVPMPKLGLTMEEAMIIEWLVADGEHVEADAPIALIETDKTETEVGSPGTGRLQHVGKAGDVFACGRTIAFLLAEGEAPAQVAPAATPAPAATAAATAAAPAAVSAATAAPPAPAPVAAIVVSGRVLASPNARRVAAERNVSLRAVRGTGPGGRIVSEDVEAAALAGTAAAPARSASALGVRAVATFAARNLADMLGVDIADVAIDPVQQCVTRDGVALHVRLLLQQLMSRPEPAPAAQPVAASAPAAALAPLLQTPTSTIRMSGMRGTIAKRMQASLREMAQLTLTMDADMTAVLADRSGRRGGGAVPSITDYVVAASARALQRHPAMNAQIFDAGIALLPEVHVGLAVAVDGGLMVPVVRDTCGRDLASLATETSRVAAAARAGTLGPADFEGGTFSVSALGAFGVDAFTPVINPPNAGILGIGRLRDDLVLVDGTVSVVKRLTLSLTWDHRVLDGVPAAEFCRTIVELLGDPQRLDQPES